VAALRQSTGQPHWIVVDEAHYFLHEPDVTQRVDVELAAYVLVTYRVSDLDPELLRSVESIVVTQLTDPREVQALTAMYGPEGAQSEWDALLRGLNMDEAALLSKVDEPQRKLQRFKVTGRLTSHVRHRAKYLQVPVPESRAFVFTCNGAPIGASARTLRELVARLPHLPFAAIDGHARQGDFSRWISEVFGDQPLAAEIHRVEQRHRRGELPDLCGSLIKPIRERYEFTG
jgi:hypothetical protein